MKNDVRPKRMSAAERREDILVAAMQEFARGGLHGTSTEAIARRVGVSQPYLFRLYGTKLELFLAVGQRCFDNVERLFVHAAAGATGSEAVLQSIGMAYGRLLADRAILMLQLQLYAACGDEQVRDMVSRRYAELYRLAKELSGADATQVREFFASGMLMNVVAAMGIASDLADVGDQEWFAKCMSAVEEPS